MPRKTKIQKLAETICSSIDWFDARRVDDIYPGFLRAYNQAQKEWEKNEDNAHFQMKRKSQEEEI